MQVPEQKRLYQKLWQKVKRAATPDAKQEALNELRKHFPKRVFLSPNELKERRKEWRRKSKQKAKMKFHAICSSFYGSTCYICGNSIALKGKQTNRVIRRLHRKDGTRHPIDYVWLYNELEKNHEKYVQLCKWCHQSVHFCMKQLGMTWDDIEKHRSVLKAESQR